MDDRLNAARRFDRLTVKPDFQCRSSLPQLQQRLRGGVLHLRVGLCASRCKAARTGAVFAADLAQRHRRPGLGRALPPVRWPASRRGTTSDLRQGAHAGQRLAGIERDRRRLSEGGDQGRDGVVSPARGSAGLLGGAGDRAVRVAQGAHQRRNDGRVAAAAQPDGRAFAHGDRRGGIVQNARSARPRPPACRCRPAPARRRRAGVSPASGPPTAGRPPAGRTTGRRPGRRRAPGHRSRPGRSPGRRSAVGLANRPRASAAWARASLSAFVSCEDAAQGRLRAAAPAAARHRLCACAACASVSAFCASACALASFALPRSSCALVTRLWPSATPL